MWLEPGKHWQLTPQACLFTICRSMAPMECFGYYLSWSSSTGGHTSCPCTLEPQSCPNPSTCRELLIGSQSLQFLPFPFSLAGPVHHLIPLTAGRAQHGSPKEESPFLPCLPAGHLLVYAAKGCSEDCSSPIPSMLPHTRTWSISRMACVRLVSSSQRAHELCQLFLIVIGDASLQDPIITFTRVLWQSSSHSWLCRPDS